MRVSEANNMSLTENEAGMNSDQSVLSISPHVEKYRC